MVKVRRPVIAVGAAVPPTAHDLCAAVRLMFNAVRLRAPLVRQLMTLVRRKLPVIVLNVLPSPLVSACLAGALGVMTHGAPTERQHPGALPH